MHRPVAEQREWLSEVLRGHFAYHGLQGNMRSMVSFAYEVQRLWLRALVRACCHSHLSYQLIYPSKTDEICFRARTMRIGNVGPALANIGESGKNKDLAAEIGKTPDQLGGLPPLKAQNQVDLANLLQRATDALRPEGGDVDSHALCKKALCMNAWAPARHREQSCRLYLGETPCPEEVLGHYAAIDVALADDEQRTRFG
jgi:hypothetical protein